MKSGTPLQEKIYEFMCSKIKSGEFSQGNQLPTEKELSEAFNLSRITVHRALQRLVHEGLIHRYPGKGSFVSKEARDLLESTSLHTGEPFSEASKPIVGFILPFVAEDFGLNVLSSAIARVEETDGSVIVSFTHQSQTAEEKAIDRAVEVGVRGLLINPVNGEYYNDAILRLHLQGFPVVMVDKRLEKLPVPSVTTDNRSSAYNLTKHLIDLGHRHIGFISPNVTATATLEDRYLGYLEALEENEIPYEHRFNLSSLPTGGVPNEQKGKSVYASIRNYLTSHPHLTAIVATEHVYAVIVEEICTQLGMSVPGDLSIVCFDSPKRVQRASFTHIQQDEEQIGSRAVELLFQLIDRNETLDDASIQFPGVLRIGDTSAPPKQ